MVNLIYYLFYPLMWLLLFFARIIPFLAPIFINLAEFIRIVTEWLWSLVLLIPVLIREFFHTIWILITHGPFEGIRIIIYGY